MSSNFNRFSRIRDFTGPNSLEPSRNPVPCEPFNVHSFEKD